MFTDQGNGSAIWLDLYDFAKDDESRIEAFRDASQASEKAFQEAKAEGKSGEEAYKASKAAYDESYRQYVNSEESVNAIINALPEIIVQTIPQEEGVDMVLVTSSDLSKENKAKVTEELLAQINYIVNTEGLDTANVAVYGAEVWEGGLMAKETVKLTVMALNGGSLAAFTAGDYATVEANNDGTYTVTVNRGGDLRLKANFIAKPGETADQGATNNPWLYVDGNCLVADLTKMVSGSILMSTPRGRWNPCVRRTKAAGPCAGRSRRGTSPMKTCRETACSWEIWRMSLCRSSRMIRRSRPSILRLRTG